MKFTTASVLAIAALGVQAANVVRDLPTIQKVITDIQSATQALDNVVKGYTTDYAPFESAASSLQNLIVSGTATVNAQPELSILDASQIASTVSGLGTDVNGTVNDLIAKKDAFVSAGKIADLLQTLQGQKTASQGLADALTAKVPSDLKEVAVELSKGISDALNRGIAAFNGLGGGTSFSAPAGPTSSTPALSSSFALSPVTWSSAVSSSVVASSVASSSVASWVSSSVAATSGSATSVSSSASATKSYTGHGSKTAIATAKGGATVGPTSPDYPTLSSPQLAPSSVKIAPAALYTGAAVAFGANQAFAAIAVAAVFAF